MLISPAANSYFMLRKSDRDEIVIVSIDDNVNDISNDFEKERFWSGIPFQSQSNSFHRGEIDPEKVIAGCLGQNAEMI